MLPQEHLVEQKNGQTASRIAQADHSERLSIEEVSVSGTARPAIRVAANEK